jgi:subtilisin family serine protease
MKRLAVILFLSGLVSGAMAQDRLIREEDFLRRQATIQAIPENPEKARAVQMADSVGLPVRLIRSDGRIVEIRRLGPDGDPEYLTTQNLNAAKTVSTSKVWKNGGYGYNLSGEGIVVGIWDGGVLRITHQEFENRGRILNKLASEEGHSTHVSGTIGAAGIDGDARGMANKVILEGYDWNNDLLEMDAAARDGLLLSNHSYGYILGFDYNTDEKRWEWWGNTDISEEEEYLFGFYNKDAQDYDRIAYNNPYYLMVKSAGNDRGEGPSPGGDHYIWQDGDWVLSNVSRQRDGGGDGFDCMGPVSTAKNILAVGAISDMPNGFTKPEAVNILSFSAFGPADDGRIKPDLVGNGEALYSCYSGSDTDYRSVSGTSMSAPNVTGSLALLQEQYHKIHGEYLKSASLKCLVLHTADDAGLPGPDYKFGWGVMNTLSAARVIGNTKYSQIQEYLLENGKETRLRLFSDGTEPIRATICWTDLPGIVPQPALDPTDRILINDLDIRIVREVDGQVFRPYVLDPVQPANAAVTGDNILDNVEQVRFGNVEKGFYEIVVSHKGELSQEKQAFSLVVSGLASEFFASGTYTLTDNNGSFMLTSAGEYIPGMEAGWKILPENGKPVSLYFNFFETESDRDLMKVYDGPDENAPLIATLSGELIPGDTIIASSGNVLWVTFSSDDQNQGKGFEAFYCTTAPEGSFAVEGEGYPCEGSEETFVASGQEGTYYRWQPPSGWILQDTGSNFVRVEIGSGDALFEVVPYNRCGATAATGLHIQPLASAPELAGYAGDTILCNGEPGTLKVDSLPGATYQWMLPKNWQGTSETHSITFIPSTDPGNVRVSAYNSCAYGDTLYIPVLVKDIPGETTIFSLSDKICQNSLHSFYVKPEEGASYQWSVGQDWQIPGNSYRDTVEVMVGENSSYLFVKASNECGFRNSNRFFLTAPQPETPLLMNSQSVYGDYRKLEVQNATAYNLIQWYLNGSLIDSPSATGSSYVAYIPGIYTVEVTNRDGCSLLQDPQGGINITGPDNLYAVHGGPEGSLVVFNTTMEPATVNIYDMTGRILLVEVAEPGRNEIVTPLKGVYIVSVFGPGNPHVARVFIQ